MRSQSQLNELGLGLMKRRAALKSGGGVSPTTPDFAASGRTHVVDYGWHPASYLTFERTSAKVIKHYAVSSGTEDSPSAWVYPQALDVCAGGFVQLVRWSYMEPTLGVYNFTAVQAALDWLAVNKPGTKMYVRILDKSYISSNAGTDFSTDTGKRMPSYMAGHVHVVYQSGVPSGFGPKLWDDYTRDRVLALVQAMAQSFGAHSALGGIIFDESTHSMNYPLDVDYDATKSVTNRKAILELARAVFPSTCAVLQPMNYFEGIDSSSWTYGTAFAEFTAWCVASGIRVALVDTCPTTPSFVYAMSQALSSGATVCAIVDAGRVYPRTDMSAGVELANTTANFNDIKAWYTNYEDVDIVMWPIASTNTLTALQAVLI